MKHRILLPSIYSGIRYIGCVLKYNHVVLKKIIVTALPKCLNDPKGTLNHSQTLTPPFHLRIHTGDPDTSQVTPTRPPCAPGSRASRNSSRTLPARSPAPHPAGSESDSASCTDRPPEVRGWVVGESEAPGGPIFFPAKSGQSPRSPGGWPGEVSPPLGQPPTPPPRASPGHW